MAKILKQWPPNCPPLVVCPEKFPRTTLALDVPRERGLHGSTVRAVELEPLLESLLLVLVVVAAAVTTGFVVVVF